MTASPPLPATPSLLSTRSIMARRLAPGEARSPAALSGTMRYLKNELRASIQPLTLPLGVMVKEPAVTPSGLTTSHVAQPTGAPQNHLWVPFPLVRGL